MRSERPVVSRAPVATIGLVALNSIVFAQEWQALAYGLLHEMWEDYAFRGAQTLASIWRDAPTLISHAFLHANVDHFAGNMIYFLLFAPAVERTIGTVRFAVLYLFWGVAAALAQVYFTPASEYLLGASGAISGVMGAYFVLFPMSMPTNWIYRFGRWTQNPKVESVGRWIGRIPAFVFVGTWFLLQLREGFYSVTLDKPYLGSSVAYWAHVGGFVAGALSMAPFLASKDEAK